MRAGGDVEKFMSLLDKKIHEAKDMLIERFEWICSQNPASAKFMYENNVMLGYKPEEGIKSALKHGTLAVGQLGLAETLELLVGCNHTHPEGMELAHRIEALFMYAKRELCEGDRVLLISSHIDCLYRACFCNDEGDCLRGTFDNSFSNAALLWNMLNDRLPDNVVVAFTGNEESDSQGAVQAVVALGRMGCEVPAALVLDVTNEGWESGALFTLENDLGIDMLTAYNIISSLECYGGRFAFKHNAEPDESWDYAEYGIPSLTLCVPVCGELHGDEGVLLRKESAMEYCNVLALLARVLN